MRTQWKRTAQILHGSQNPYRNGNEAHLDEVPSCKGKFLRRANNDDQFIALIFPVVREGSEPFYFNHMGQLNLVNLLSPFILIKWANLNFLTFLLLYYYCMIYITLFVS